MNEKIKELYLKGYSGREVASILGISKSKTLDIIKKMGISRKNMQYRDKHGRFNKKGKTSNPKEKIHNTISTYRNIINENSTCEHCGTKERLEVHHIDKNRNNNDIKNLKILCKNCHLKVHPRLRDELGRFKK